jgi:hypothetical protein
VLNAATRTASQFTADISIRVPPLCLCEQKID